MCYVLININIEKQKTKSNKLETCNTNTILNNNYISNSNLVSGLIAFIFLIYDLNKYNRESTKINHKYRCSVVTVYIMLPLISQKSQQTN